MRKTVSVAIVEDEEFSAQTMISYLERYSKTYDLDIQTTRFFNGEEFLRNYKPCFDIVFMDIMMPNLNGMETAKKLRVIDHTVPLIFVTNLAKFAVKGYEVSALDFIVKPVVYDTFVMKMNKAVRAATSCSLEKVVIKKEGGSKIIAVSEICYIEVYNHDLIYYTTQGEIRSHGSLNTIEKELSKNNFVRCSGGFLVNLHYVNEVRGNSCIVGGTEIPIGRSKKKQFMEALSNYLGRGI